MAERGILFSAPMVRALLAGRKTQTRRAVKPHRADDAFVLVGQEDGSWWPYRSPDGESMVMGDGCEYPFSCPYGAPGNRLWVRETFNDDRGETIYRADGGMPADWFDAGSKWRPSIFMPRAASRITLEVTEVRVERLQDISEADAIAEGVVEHQTLRPGTRACNIDGGMMHACGPVPVYRWLWESINGPGSWELNPWVWAVSFRRAPRDPDGEVLEA